MHAGRDRALRSGAGQRSGVSAQLFLRRLVVLVSLRRQGLCSRGRRCGQNFLGFALGLRRCHRHVLPAKSPAEPLGVQQLRHDAGVTYRSPTLADVVATLRVDRVDDHRFVATQLDNPAHHIVGGHIAGQALMAASLTAPGRRPHSVHVYYVRAGDAREPVDLHVDVVRDGGTLSTRQITARQDDQILLEALASFSVSLESHDYHQSMPDVADPDSLPPVQEQVARYAGELGGHWVRPQPFDMRYVDAPPRLAIEMPEAAARMRMWWRPNGSVPADDVLHSCLPTYLSGTTMVEVALAQRRATPSARSTRSSTILCGFTDPSTCRTGCSPTRFRPVVSGVGV
jgi:acyl-CoA thioesterase II